MKTVKREIASAMLVSKDNKILLGKQRQGGVYPDCWHIPGGGVDEGETKEEALIREIKEEVGIDIYNYSIILVSDTDHGSAVKTDKKTGEQFVAEMHFNTFRVDIDLNEQDIVVSLDDDLVDYKWVDMSDLKNFKHTPPSEKLFQKLGYL